ncbi:carcinoembryonic antigen-related cell adhesion molecule 5-like [Clupea harengus]|uniref:Carcinoembryonic antigen-related cell adhesion molecule 5-like n=1 Tax=Clupea harengus TaxID=7950 RepID=A0A6P8FZ25_CLUHA|nr:carcinoembryonic antigen-related cell adhesion molecule 5-like [Clupea harengus]
MVMEVGEPPILNWTFTLSCNVTGPVDSVHWMMNGSYLHSDERRSLSEGNMTLTFSPVRHSDDGSYQCSAFNAVSNRTSSGFSLRVNYGPEKMAISGPSIVATGTNVTLTCSDSSWPPSEVSWFFNGSRVATGPVYQKESVSPADSGQYNCTAHNNITGYSRSATKMLTVIDVISMVMVNKVDGPPELNMTFKLSCDVTGPVDSTYWMRNGTYLQSNDRTSFSNRNMTLTFSPVEHSDNGDYQCVAMNAVSERNSSEYMLMVYYGPWGTAITGPHVATPGSNVTFSCAATSWPPSVYSWYFNGSMVGEGPLMELTNLTFMDRGEYTCKAHNSVTGKNSSASTNLRVVALLTVVTADPKNEQPILGRSFRLTCSANSETTAIYWMKDGMYLGWNSNVSFSEGNVTMTIESVTHADNGDYQCTAHNDVSKKTSSVYQLKVKFGPYNVMVSGPEMAETGSPATFDCSATSWPPSVYSWYFNDSMVANGSVYTTEPLTVGGSGNYTCMALNWVTGMNSSATAELRVIGEVQGYHGLLKSVQ